jgi:hypothetical protein
MNMWFLNLPDILVFFAIWGCGFLTGLFIMVLATIMFCWGGGAIHIRYTKDEITGEKIHF